MGYERTYDEPGEDSEEAPNLAAVLTETVRSAALQLPRDRAVPVVDVVDPFPEDAAR